MPDRFEVAERVAVGVGGHLELGEHAKRTEPSEPLESGGVDLPTSVTAVGAEETPSQGSTDRPDRCPQGAGNVERRM